MLTPLDLCQQQFNVIMLNYERLMFRCNSAQAQELKDLKDNASSNLTDAQNSVFDTNDAALTQLLAQGQDALHDVNAAIAHIADIVTTLNAITNLVGIAGQVAALGA